MPANLSPELTIIGDIHSNQNVTIMPGTVVQGKVYAVGTVDNWGVVTGGIVTGCKPVKIPPILYYGYRPSYDYGGLDNDAVELPGTFLLSNPPNGMPNNPNNVFYSDASSFELCHGVKFTQGTMIAMYDLRIVGNVSVIASAGFPALIINDDVELTDGCVLSTEGLVKVRDHVRGREGVAAWRGGHRKA